MADKRNETVLPLDCPSCGTSWRFFKPAKCAGSDHVRCIECKATYLPASPSPTPSAGVDAVAICERQALQYLNGEPSTATGRMYQRACRDCAEAIRSALTPAPAPVEAGGEVFESDKTRAAVEPVRAMLDEGINIQATGELTNAVVQSALQACISHIDELEADFAALRTAVALAKPAPAVDAVRERVKEARKYLIDGDPLSAWRTLDGIIAALAKPAPTVETVREGCASIVDAAAAVARSQADECRDEHPERAERYDASAIVLDEAAALIRALAPAAQAGTVAQEGER